METSSIHFYLFIFVYLSSDLSVNLYYLWEQNIGPDTN